MADKKETQIESDLAKGMKQFQETIAGLGKLDFTKGSIPQSETSVSPMIIEQKDSIKITKNSKGYNFEFRVVGENLLEQVDKMHHAIKERIAKWEIEEEGDLN